MDCAVCGASFELPPRSKRKTCSKKCASQLANQSRDIFWNEERLALLKAEYEAAQPPKRLDTKRLEEMFGKPARHITIVANKHGFTSGARHPKRDSATCDTCGKEFVPANKNSKFCGRACYAESRKGKPQASRKSPWHNPHARGTKGFREDLGIYMRSRWEANVARFLNILILTGYIASWEYEPQRFTFPVKRGITSYTPDFRIFRTDGSHYWLEVKGWMDKPSQTKIKRFGIHYKSEELEILDEKTYKALEKELQDIVPLWEKRA